MERLAQRARRAAREIGRMEPATLEAGDSAEAGGEEELLCGGHAESVTRVRGSRNDEAGIRIGSLHELCKITTLSLEFRGRAARAWPPVSLELPRDVMRPQGF